MSTFRFDYTVTAYGRPRSSIKTIKSYSLPRAVELLVLHACRKWADAPIVTINNAEKDGIIVNPDILPEMQKLADSRLATQRTNPPNGTHEPGEYDWACLQCGRVFRPRRMFNQGPLQKVCGTCALNNLVKFIEQPDEP